MALVDDLRVVLDYVQPDEEHDFNLHPDETDTHVVFPIRRLRAWLNGEHGPERGLIEAIERIQRMRDELDAEWAVPPESDEEAREDYLADMDSEDYGRYQEAGHTFARVLDVLQALAHGLTPAQGEAGDGSR